MLIIIVSIMIVLLLFATAIYAYTYYAHCPECGSPDIEFKTVYNYDYYYCPTPGCDIVAEQRIEYWVCDDPECGYVWDMDDFRSTWHTDPNCPYAPQRSDDPIIR